MDRGVDIIDICLHQQSELGAVGGGGQLHLQPPPRVHVVPRPGHGRHHLARGAEAGMLSVMTSAVNDQSVKLYNHGEGPHY